MKHLVGRRGRSPLAAVVVAGVHALLLLGLLRATLVRDATVPEAPAVFLLLEDRAVREPDLQPEPDAGTRREAPQRAAQDPVPRPAPDAAAGPAPTPAAGAPVGSTAARGWTDWFALGEKVARERAARDAAAARPAPAPFRAAPEGPRAPNVFADRRRRTGTSEKRADGESIFWINENCYVSTESTSLTQRELHDARRDAVQCVMRLGKREARGDLFDELPNHRREGRPDDPTLPDGRGGTGPGGSPEPLPADLAGAER
ncbi:MAG: hypothetical protein MUF07_08625 [Steroidobacteraceae bacterium]|jgi:hypothetical protein|nr:hypothetical protein [Steroidobacteraceae bacterium]